MINLSPEVPITETLTGYFFKPEACNYHEYVVTVVDVEQNTKCLVVVYEFVDIEDITLINGDLIRVPVFSVNEYLSLYICGKYYFHRFFSQHPNHNYQWYHDNNTSPGDEIKGLYEVLVFAYKIGIKSGNIKPY